MLLALTLATGAYAIDADHDGWSVPSDCNDHNARVHPGAAEVLADGVDQSCDGRELCAADGDNDRYSHATATVLSTDLDCTDPGEWARTASSDCNDANAAIHPAATELVADGVDQNCDGRELCRVDGDHDGYAPFALLVLSNDTDCLDVGEAYDTVPDCNDAAAMISPGATEVVGDGVDQSCDGREVCFVDADGDGARTLSTVSSPDVDCADPFEASAAASIDCDDTNATIWPGAVERCNGIDDDCDGALEAIWLSGPLPPAPGLAAFDVYGGPALADAELYGATALGASDGACPADVDAAEPLAYGVTDLNGDATLSADVPAGASGQVWYAEVVFPDTCARSCLAVTPIP